MKDIIYQQIEFAQRQAEIAPSQEEYFKWVGYIQGLRFVLGLPSENSDVPAGTVEQGGTDESEDEALSLERRRRRELLIQLMRDDEAAGMYQPATRLTTSFTDATNRGEI